MAREIVPTKKDRGRTLSFFDLCFALPYSTGLNFAMPYSTARSRAELCRALLCLAEFSHHPSQTNSRQFGGMIPARKADAIMPWCLKSARRTWQRRHNVRRFFNELSASLPDLIWSQWALFKGSDHSEVSLQYGPKHRPLSRSQTVLRVFCQSSFG